MRKQGIQPGDQLVLTKPLGIGTLFAANMRLAAKGRWIDQAIDSMLLSHQNAVPCLQKHYATACTDVTGFGLGGHLLEMLEGTKISIELNLNQLPILEGAFETLSAGYTSSLAPENRDQFLDKKTTTKLNDSPTTQLLFDPQTSGGLLASIPHNRVDECLAELRNLGYPDSSIIGTATKRQADQPPIELRY